MAGIAPIELKLRELTDIYFTIKRSFNNKALPALIVEPTLPLDEWPHPAYITQGLTESVSWQDKIEIYTDGSKMNNEVGAALVIYGEDNTLHETIQIRLASWCSNNQAELVAILKALQWLAQQDVDGVNKNAIVMTDSHISIDKIKNYKARSLMVSDIRNMIKSLRDNGWKISIEKVSEHIGIQDNEEAGAAAKEATENAELETTVTVVPKSYIISMTSKITLAQWEERWRRSTKGLQTKKFFPTVESRMAVELKHHHMLTQLISGHGRTGNVSRFHTTPSECDRPGRPQQTWGHILFDCPIQELRRKSLIRDAVFKGGQWPPTVEKTIDI
ncbi:uncharacterized protein LOC106666852 [Cimex lectularius]|uniref:RNase H type-1 domain-containing protein n=1 Tax=Cimex lectularius TaxID=79782 RepID=A0A8I6RTK8_CIMLE|nr:uncharacterized protein LOC106666852 [Cimex lectularius]